VLRVIDGLIVADHVENRASGDRAAWSAAGRRRSDAH
jgi:hypothetical protein